MNEFLQSLELPLCDIAQYVPKLKSLGFIDVLSLRLHAEVSDLCSIGIKPGHIKVLKQSLNLKGNLKLSMSTLYWWSTATCLLWLDSVVNSIHECDENVNNFREVFLKRKIEGSNLVIVHRIEELISMGFPLTWLTRRMFEELQKLQQEVPFAVLTKDEAASVESRAQERIKALNTLSLAPGVLAAPFSIPLSNEDIMETYFQNMRLKVYLFDLIWLL